MDDEQEQILNFIDNIRHRLSIIGNYAPWADDQQVMSKLQQLDMDSEILQQFFLNCLETWDEESRIVISSIFTALRVLAVNSNGLIQNRLIDTWPVDVEAFHSLVFEIEGKFQQIKLHIEQWCQYLLRSSSLNWPIIDHHLNILRNILSLVVFQPRAANKNSCKNQIDLFHDKVAYLFDLQNLELDCEKLLGAFCSNAMCIVFLYWAKEADEEIANDMNILLFDMSQKLIPYAPDLSILISQNSLASSDSVILFSPVDNFVDFFFKHLDDDLLILRDPLIFFFTFLTSPHESAKPEDVSQIYALFREHSYFFLSFGEMKEDPSNKKMLLSDFMTQIEIANAKIRQLYFDSFTDSCITLKAEKMDSVYFVSISRELYFIEKDDMLADLVSQVPLYRMELKFMRLFLVYLAKCDDGDEEIRARLSSIITSLQGIWQKEEEEKGPLATRLHAIRQVDAADWHPLAFELEQKIHMSKIVIESWCLNLFDWSISFRPSTSYKVVMFLNSILDILNDLVTYKAGEIVPFKKQIETLEQKLLFFKNFLNLTVNCIDGKELGEFKMFVQAFANDATCLVFLYFAKDGNEKIAYEFNLMLTRILQKINPDTPVIAGLHFQALKAISIQQCDSLLFGQTTSIFVDFFIENLVTSFNDDFQILHDEVIFLLTFMNDPPNRNSREVSCSHVNDLFWEDVYAFLPFDNTEGDFVKKKRLLGDFILKIGTVNEKIMQLYNEFPVFSSNNIPNIISPLFLDFIIQNLQNMKEKMISDGNFVPFAKYKIIKVKEELVALRPFFNCIFDLQNEQNEAWLEVVNLLHLTEQIVNSSINSWFVFDQPIWCQMSNLSDVIDRIKVIKTKLEKIKENTMYNAQCLPHPSSFISTPSVQAKASQINEIFVGFEDDAEIIIGQLTCQHKSLDIVSIVGMGGLGKTTLARHVSSSVKSKFDVFAFCIVSQDHNTKRLLMDILLDIEKDDDRIHQMTEDDLAHHLWKRLSRQKYLIVLDDIWNVSAWNKVERSFPNDQNGSRVMFTTRSFEVADRCKINCSPHQLRFLSEAESWELLQRMVFHNGISPPNLYEIGRIISKNCKGLPLAVVVIAGLLAKTKKSLSWWSEVAQKISSYLYDEGCMEILELSYKHLPAILKPCLLYLGAFPEDTLIEVKKVILLWIAEGFVQESKTKILEDVAKDYVHDLVNRSLIIVSARSSGGEIKKIRVHDLIHDLCRTKCQDMNFFQVNHEIASSSSSDSSINNNYRVSMYMRSDITVVGGSSKLNARSLLYFCDNVSVLEIEDFPFKEFRLGQVMASDLRIDIEQLSSLVHLRHLETWLGWSKPKCILSLIYNFWNIGSLILKNTGDVQLTEMFWRMKSLRHVEVKDIILEFLDDHEYEAYPKLDKVVRFSRPVLYSGKDLQRLLQRLPAVRKLHCLLRNDPKYGIQKETLDFHGKIESLMLVDGSDGHFLINNFPSNLQKLSLACFELPWTTISTLTKLHFLQVLKLKWILIPEQRLEMEDMTFQNLKFFELICGKLEQWNVTIESLPCLEQLVIGCPMLEELPSCFGEMSTLKRIVLHSEVLMNSALQIQEELMQLGSKVEVVEMFNS